MPTPSFASRPLRLALTLVLPVALLAAGCNKDATDVVLTVEVQDDPVPDIRQLKVDLTRRDTNAKDTLLFPAQAGDPLSFPANVVITFPTDVTQVSITVTPLGPDGSAVGGVSETLETVAVSAHGETTATLNLGVLVAPPAIYTGCHGPGSCPAPLKCAGVGLAENPGSGFTFCTLDCEPGRDSSCGPDMDGHPGKCQTFTGVGSFCLATCTTSDDCPTGLGCSMGICKSTCTSAADCGGSGFVCQPNPGEDRKLCFTTP